MAKFALVLHQDPNIHKDDSPQDIQNIVQEYIAWRSRIAEDGKMIGGAKLGDDGGRLMTGHGSGLRVVEHC